MYGEAYCRGRSVRGRQRKVGVLKRWSFALLCVASRWLTSLGRKPSRTPNMHYVKTWVTAESEVNNALHCLHMRIEPRPHVTCTENFVKFARVVFEIMRADRHSDHNTLFGREVKIQRQSFAISWKMSLWIYSEVKILQFHKFTFF